MRTSTFSTARPTVAGSLSSGALKETTGAVSVMPRTTADSHPQATTKLVLELAGNQWFQHQPAQAVQQGGHAITIEQTLLTTETTPAGSNCQIEQTCLEF
ncbi:UNKNOWN [Stylonychia lemnae]|uniref:Uncharacterized protein n=1 Tax=Stylonychia lemnae TaxID=5949 RepID=A0A077ZY89_STYLE|nr:UNKNOWN [Stylonychia lemnae]|eukprot:CDW74192.1 UNKNOWN [Stylonychia lemnae]